MNSICKKLLIVTAAMMLPLAGCSGGSSGTKTSSAAPAESSAEVTGKTDSTEKKTAESAANTNEKKTSETSSTSGVTKTVGDFEVTMESAVKQNVSGNFTPEDGNTYVVTVFRITNNSNETTDISSGINFDATADGQDIYQAWMVTPEDVEWIDGNVEPGQSIEGCVCFEAPDDFKELKIRFIPDPMAADSADFTINQ